MCAIDADDMIGIYESSEHPSSHYFISNGFTIIYVFYCKYVWRCGNNHILYVGGTMVVLLYLVWYSGLYVFIHLY